MYVCIYIFLFATEKALYKSFISLLYVPLLCSVFCHMKAHSMLLFLIFINNFGNNRE